MTVQALFSNDVVALFLTEEDEDGNPIEIFEVAFPPLQRVALVYGDPAQLIRDQIDAWRRNAPSEMEVTHFLMRYEPVANFNLEYQ